MVNISQQRKILPNISQQGKIIPNIPQQPEPTPALLDQGCPEPRAGNIHSANQTTQFHMEWVGVRG